MNTTTLTSPSDSPARAPWARHAWIAGGAIAIAAAGVTAGLAWRPVTDAAVDGTAKTATPTAVEAPIVEQPLPKPAAARVAPEKADAPRKVAVCANCGVVESVREVQVQGEGSGLGAIAGGVLGGAVGNQVGKGNGRKAMTVLGAVGGGLAGHEIEKRARAETLYDVKVRMDDGSVKTIRQKSAPAGGSRVRVEGNVARALG